MNYLFKSNFFQKVLSKNMQLMNLQLRWFFDRTFFQKFSVALVKKGVNAKDK
jgi:hypothetical protein